MEISFGVEHERVEKCGEVIVRVSNFKYFLFSPLFGEMIQFDYVYIYNIFEMG